MRDDQRQIFRFLLFLSIALFPSVVFSATYSSVQSGNWNDPATWGSGTYPKAGDDVTVNSSHTVTSVGSNTALDVGHLTLTGILSVDGSLTVSNSFSFNNNASLNVGRDLQISGDFTTDGDMVVGGDCSMSGNFTNGYLRTCNIGGQLSVSGSITNSGILTVSGNLSSFTGTVTNNYNQELNVGGDLYAYGDVTNNGNFTVDGSCSIANGNLNNNNASFFQINNDLTIVVDITNNGTLVTGNLSLTGNLTNNYQDLMVVNGDLVINGDVTVDGNLVVAGNYTSESGNTTINYNGSVYVFSSVVCSGSDCYKIMGLIDWQVLSSPPGETYVAFNANGYCEGNADAVVSSGVTNEGNALGVPDNNYAELDNSNDILDLDITDLLNAGGTISIRWRLNKNGNGTGKIEFSTDGNSWSSTSYSVSLSSSWTNSSFTLPISTRYLRITRPSGNRTLEVDAVSYYANCSTDPLLSVSPSSLGFGYIANGEISPEQTYTLSGVNLTGAPGNITITAPAGFEVSLASGGGFASSVDVAYSSETLSNTTIYVRFSPTMSNQNYSGNIVNSGGGASAENVAVTGTSIVSYCSSSGTTDYNDGITLVDFNTINNSSDKPSGYSDYTAQSTDVIIGNTYNLTVNLNTDGPFTNYAMAWIDWNQDGDFLDAGESYDLGYAIDVIDGATSNSPLAITIPATAVTGNTRMRVSTQYGQSPTSCNENFDGEVEDYSINILSPCNAPTVFNVTGGGTYCEGGVGLEVGLDGSESGVTYQLLLDGVALGSPLSGNGTAISFGNQTSNGTYTVVATRTSESCTVDMSGSVDVTVNPVLTASVSIAADPGNSICESTSVTFAASPTNGGASPIFQWKKNGVNVGTNSSIYTDSGLADGDQISVEMTSDYECVTGSPATSNVITMSVSPVLPISVSITSNSATICEGSSVTFTATPTNGGTNPTYQWNVNGVDVGTNSNQYTYTPNDGDVISCTLSSNSSCLTGSSKNLLYFSWNDTTKPLTDSDTGIDAISINDGQYVAGGVDGTTCLAPITQNVNIELTFDGNNPIFNSDGIDYSIAYRRDESVSQMFTRGSSLVISGGSDLSVSYRVSDGSSSYTTVSSGNVYSIPTDNTFHTYRFVYDPSDGYGRLYVDDSQVWISSISTQGLPMYWSGAGDVVVGVETDASGNQTPTFDNLLIKAIDYETATDQMTVSVQPIPTIAATGTDATSCGDNGMIDYTFTNVPDGTYQIDYDGGSFSGVTVTGGSARVNAPVGSYNNLSITVNGCTSTENVNVTISAPSNPDLTNFSASLSGGSDICLGASATIDVVSSTLASGSYVVTYNLSAPNLATNQTANMNFTASSGGSFNTSALAASGTTTLTIVSVENSVSGCSATPANPVTVDISVDITAPAISCPPDGTADCVKDLPLGATDYNSFVALGGTASDNCTASQNLSVTYHDVTDPGVNCRVTRTYIVTDEANNSDSCQQVFTINDVTAPTLTGSDLELTPTDGCFAKETVPAPNANDFCSYGDEAPSYTYNLGGIVKTGTGDVVNELFPLGTTIIHWSLQDECGHTGTWDQNVVVVFPLTAISYDNGSSSVSLGSGVNPMLTSTHTYYVDSKIPESGYSYIWNLYLDNDGNGIIDGSDAPVNSSLYQINNSTNGYNEAFVAITFNDGLDTIQGHYIISVTKKTQNITPCEKQETLPVTIQSNSSFDVVLESFGDQCQFGGTGTVSSITWNVKFPVIYSEPFKFNYTITVDGLSVNSGTVSNITYSNAIPQSPTDPGTPPYVQYSKSVNSYTVFLQYSFQSTPGIDKRIGISIEATDVYEVSEPVIKMTNNNDELNAYGIPTISFN